MEQNLIREKFDRILSMLKNRYSSIHIDGKEYIQLEDGTIVLIEYFPSGMMGACYAANIEEARNNMFEDGDGYDCKRMSEDEVFAALVTEMEG